MTSLVHNSEFLDKVERFNKLIRTYNARNHEEQNELIQLKEYIIGIVLKFIYDNNLTGEEDIVKISKVEYGINEYYCKDENTTIQINFVCQNSMCNISVTGDIEVRVKTATNRVKRILQSFSDEMKCYFMLTNSDFRKLLSEEK